MTPNSQPPLFEITGLSVDFETRHHTARALHDIDLVVRRGEALGIVGESGCGKSITWMASLGLLGRNAQVRGSAKLAGQEIVGIAEKSLNAIRGGRIAMIFQDPSSSLNPLHKIGWQLTEALVLHRGLHGRAARAEAERLLDRVGIANASRRVDDYPHEFSGGMNQRVMIAMALAGNPELLVADEPTTALDATIQAQILDLLDDLRKERGMALVLISHDLSMVAEMTERVVVMYSGRVVEDASTQHIFASPAHPYTAGLVAALPDLEGPRRRLTAIPGTVPAPDRLPPGCAFAPRCNRATAACADGVPGLRDVAGAGRHRTACIHHSGSKPALRPVEEMA